MSSVYAILAAMPDELAPYLGVAQDLKQLSIDIPPAGPRFYLAKIADKQVMLVTTGVGLVNAAIAATIAVSNGAEALISTGSAGGVGKGIKVGDVVAATETLFSTADATAFTDYALGQIPGLPARFTSDTQLLEAVVSRRGASSPQPTDSAYPSVAEGGPSVSKPQEHGKIHNGLILSGDAFIWEKNYADYVGKFPDAAATDMETAAIGQVAYQFGVPWISVRGISDLCGPQGADDFLTHLDGAANIAADVVVELLKNFY